MAAFPDALLDEDEARAVRVVGHVEPVFVEQVTDISAAVLDLIHDGDVVLVMGAGSIGQVAARIAEDATRAP